jgi:hypothetical protein
MFVTLGHTETLEMTSYMNINARTATNISTIDTSIANN